MGEALALDAAWLFAAFLILLVLAAAGIAVRRFLLERGGATVECGLRRPGGSWRLGLASYQRDEFCWYRVFGFSMRPEQAFPRRDLAVVARRAPTREEVIILGPGRIVAECTVSGGTGGAGGTREPGGTRETGRTHETGGTHETGETGGVRGAGVGEFGGAGGAVDLALAESALTGLLAWLEAGPAGSHLDVAL